MKYNPQSNSSDSGFCRKYLAVVNYGTCKTFVVSTYMYVHVHVAAKHWNRFDMIVYFRTKTRYALRTLTSLGI